MRRYAIGLFLMCGVCLPSSLTSQGTTAKVVPNPDYGLSPAWRGFLGSNWRDLWTAPVSVQVLNLNTFAGGLTAYKDGGNQTNSLRFHGADGQTYMFRSTKKFVARTLPKDLRGSPAGKMMDGQGSSMHPTGVLAVSALETDLGVLHADQRLVMLPDDPRLGEFRKKYAGTMGTIEPRPNDGKNDVPVSFGADAIEGTADLFASLEASLDARLDSRDYLTVRLVDFLIGDTDRGADQYAFARFDKGNRKVYRPVPQDRDYAFLNLEGLVASFSRGMYPKLPRFQSHMPPLHTLLFMTAEFDRSQLVDLPWAAWDSVVARIQTRLNDAAIAEAVHKLPPEHFALSGERIVATLRSRRDGLRDRAYEYFLLVNQTADVFASNEGDLAEIDRASDGSVTVRMFSAHDRASGGDPAFSRRFVPDQTKEIRVFMQGGDDRVVVRGSSERSIMLRVTGGTGDDTLIDSSRVAHGGALTAFYDAHGHNTVIKGAHTTVDRREFRTPQPVINPNDDDPPPLKPGDIEEERRGRFLDLTANGGANSRNKLPVPDSKYWGGAGHLTPSADWASGFGLKLGMSYSTTRYGFRSTPYASRLQLRGLYALGGGRGVGFSGVLDIRPANTRRAFVTTVHATQLDADRFFGFGNDSPDLVGTATFVKRDELVVQPSMRWYMRPSDWISVGPILWYAKTKPEAGSPAEAFLPAEFMRFGQVGAEVLTTIDHRNDPVNPHTGFYFKGGASYYPTVWDVKDPYGTANGTLAVYLPLGSPTLALRAGGARVFGNGFPLHDAAFIGGRQTLRGYSWDRYVGDAEAHAAAELRVPLVRMTLLTHGTLGVVGSYDVGRVWMDGLSPGGWHKAVGGGLSFSTLGAVVAAGYVHGSGSARVYLSYGFDY